MRDLAIFVVVLLITTIVGLYTTIWWSEFALIGRTFSGFSTFGFWWSPLHLLNFLDEFVLLFLAGAVLVVATSFRRPILCGLLLGIAFTCIRLALSTSWTSPTADFNDYLWIYSEYFMSPIGALIGALAGSKLRARVRSRVVA